MTSPDEQHLILLMKPPQTGALMCAFFMASAISIFAQGSLTPPAAPTPTMKSLDQIEARTPISSLPFPINSSGSYYLTKNLGVSSGNAITISVSGVTLDLNGFTLSSTTASAAGYGILITSGLRDITILNGHIRGGVTQSGGTYSGSGFGYGIAFTGTAPASTLIFHVSVSGCKNDGINPGASFSTVVESCTVQTVGGAGIVATAVKASSALECGGIGIIGNQISDCWGSSVLTHGIYGTVVQNCYGSATGATAFGIYAFTAQNCYGAALNSTNTTGDSGGIYASTAQNCYGTATTVGLLATNAENCYGISTGNAFGLDVSMALNCYGSSNTSYGLYASLVAQNCLGQSNSSIGLYAYIAIASVGYNSGGTSIDATRQYFCGSGPAVYP
jgi:hypothetical protein